MWQRRQRTCTEADKGFLKKIIKIPRYVKMLVQIVFQHPWEQLVEKLVWNNAALKDFCLSFNGSNYPKWQTVAQNLAGRQSKKTLVMSISERKLTDLRDFSSKSLVKCFKIHESCLEKRKQSRKRHFRYCCYCWIVLKLPSSAKWCRNASSEHWLITVRPPDRASLTKSETF